MATYKEKHTILSGAGLVYTLPSKKTPVWQMRLKFPKRLRSKYYIKSTGHTDLGHAISFATETYQRMLADLQEGVRTGSKAYSSVLDEFLTYLVATESVSPSSLKNFRYHRKYWSEFFRDTELPLIDTAMLADYIVWRKAYWRTGPGSKVVNRPASVRERPSYSSLKNDRQRQLQFLRWCKENKIIRDIPTFRTISTSKSNKGRRKVGGRDHFTSVEWRSLRELLRQYAFGKSSQSVGAAHRFNRANLYYLVMISANLGTRTGETLSLTWGCVRFRKSTESEDVTRVEVDIPRDNKTGTRIAYGTLNCASYFKKLKELQKERFGREPNRNDPVFVTHSGDASRYPGKSFRKLLIKWNLYKDSNGRRRDLYSLRGLYITYCLDKGLPIRQVAKMCGTSVKQIEAHYDRGVVHLTDEQLANKI